MQCLNVTYKQEGLAVNQLQGLPVYALYSYFSANALMSRLF